MPLIYDELRRLAAQKVAHEWSGQTLEATALVHESYRREQADDSARDATAGFDQQALLTGIIVIQKDIQPATRPTKDALGVEFVEIGARDPLPALDSNLKLSG